MRMRPASVVSCVLLAVTLARAQFDTLPPRPVPATSPTPLTYQPPPPPDPPPASSPFEAGPLGPVRATPDGFFANVELAVLFPTIRSGQSGPLGVPPSSLGTTVSPTFEIGYKAPDGQGLFAIGYRFLGVKGSGDPYSSLYVNSVNLDYGILPYEFAPRYTLAWRLGARIDDIVFDARNSAGQRSRNDFFGGGLHARGEIERRIVPVPGLSLYGSLDGAVLIGRVQQRYNDAVGSVSDRDPRTVPVIKAQAGLSYVPPLLPALKVTGGYLYERYFSVGSLGLTSGGRLAASDGDVDWHGFFLRGQVDF